MRNGALHLPHDDSCLQKPTPQDILIASALSPDALLDLTANFIVFEPEGERTVKIARYQQFIAVNRAMRRSRTAANPAARGGVVWHTQGSGLTVMTTVQKFQDATTGWHPTLSKATNIPASNGERRHSTDLLRKPLAGAAR